MLVQGQRKPAVAQGSKYACTHVELAVDEALAVTDSNTVDVSHLEGRLFQLPQYPIQRIFTVGKLATEQQASIPQASDVSDHSSRRLIRHMAHIRVESDDIETASNK